MLPKNLSFAIRTVSDWNNLSMTKGKDWNNLSLESG